MYYTFCSQLSCTTVAEIFCNDCEVKRSWTAIAYDPAKLYNVNCGLVRCVLTAKPIPGPVLAVLAEVVTGTQENSRV